jgi:hypothetical protein
LAEKYYLKNGGNDAKVNKLPQSSFKIKILGGIQERIIFNEGMQNESKNNYNRRKEIHWANNRNVLR